MHSLVYSSSHSLSFWYPLILPCLSSSLLNPSCCSVVRYWLSLSKCVYLFTTAPVVVIKYQDRKQLKEACLFWLMVHSSEWVRNSEDGTASSGQIRKLITFFKHMWETERNRKRGIVISSQSPTWLLYIFQQDSVSYCPPPSRDQVIKYLSPCEAISFKPPPPLGEHFGLGRL